MPVGTQGSVKAVSPRELEELGAGIVLGNTYHLCLRPGMEVIRQAGGLHRFASWPHAILTDSGGYQVFSLAKLRKVREDGVEFRSHIDGSAMFLGPREAMAIQRDIGSDIAMVFDECPPYPCAHDEAAASLKRTLRWARLCREQPRADGQLVFGIVQGGAHLDLRAESAAALIDIGFDGYALGGLSVGEPQSLMYDIVAHSAPLLPDDRARYLMGVGTPPQLIEAVARGIDMFDCVLPTRVARNGSAYTRDGMIQAKAGRWKTSAAPLDADCTCYACANFSRGYIRHLLNVGEILGLRLVTLHNLHFYLTLMREVREAIRAGTFSEYRRDFHTRYIPPAGDAAIGGGAAPASS
jgi:queuine tRNA-ribosyltransferase